MDIISSSVAAEQDQADAVDSGGFVIVAATPFPFAPFPSTEMKSARRHATVTTLMLFTVLSAVTNPGDVGARAKLI